MLCCLGTKLGDLTCWVQGAEVSCKPGLPLCPGGPDPQPATLVLGLEFR